MSIRTIAVTLALAVPAAVATAHAAVAVKKKVETNRLVRKHVRNDRKYRVVVPKDKDVRAIHLVTDSGKLLSVPVDALRLGGGVSAQAANQCGINKELWTRWVAVDKCCRYDSSNNCTATQECKQDVSTCINPSGEGTYTAHSAPYSCLPLACPPPASTEPTTTQTPSGF
ncbi:MAG: hypothetical protein AAF721_11805 [Myxococcota bacterium]